MNRKLLILVVCALGVYAYTQFASWSEFRPLQQKAILNASSLHFPTHAVIMETGDRVDQAGMLKLMASGQMEFNSVGDSYRFLPPDEREQLFKEYDQIWYRNLAIASLVGCIVACFALKGGHNVK